MQEHSRWKEQHDAKTWGQNKLGVSWNIRKSERVELSKWGGIYTWKGFRKLTSKKGLALTTRNQIHAAWKGLGCLQRHQMGDFNSTQMLSLNGTTFPIFSTFPTIQLGHQPCPGILLWISRPSWVGCPSLCSHSSLHLSHLVVIENFRFNLYLPLPSISFLRAGTISIIFVSAFPMAILRIFNTVGGHYIIQLVSIIWSLLWSEHALMLSAGSHLTLSKTLRPTCYFSHVIDMELRLRVVK